MAKGILGRKIGMTQIFGENGILIPVTVIDVADNVVLQQKTVETDGYTSTQVGFETKRDKLSSKPEMGHVEKANTAPKRFVKEIRFREEFKNELASLAVGDVISPEIFAVGEAIDVTGTSKGKGFQGTIKRYNHSMGPASHGSRYHRGAGSMGPIKGNLKGKKLPGHMGDAKTTVQNLHIVAVDIERNIILVSGSIPGPKKGLVIVKSATKQEN